MESALQNYNIEKVHKITQSKLLKQNQEMFNLKNKM